MRLPAVLGGINRHVTNPILWPVRGSVPAGIARILGVLRMYDFLDMGSVRVSGSRKRLTTRRSGAPEVLLSTLGRWI
jgi:hypothetical protein